MSQITDWAAQEEADLSTISGSLDGIVADIAALDAKIVTLQNSPDDQAALDAVSAASKALVAKSAAILTPAPPAPTA